MSRAAKICSQPQCPNLQPCPAHLKEPWAGSQRRERVRSRYRGELGQERKRFVINRDDGICHVCGRPGADEADHVIPLGEGGADHVSNMAAIHSVPCHREKTAEEAARGRKR